MSSETPKVEQLSETAILVKRLIAVDVILAKAVGASQQQVYRVVERRMYKSLCAVFAPMADAALEEVSGIDGDKPFSESESKALAARINKHFAGWEKGTSDVVNAVVEDVYGSSKQEVRARVLVARKKSMRVSKAGPSLGSSFTTEDENAIGALAGHQVFWIGKQYTDNLSKQISSFTDEYMLRSGLGRREAGEKLKDALAKEFGLKSGPLDRGSGLELPPGWKGTTQQYFRMLSANTVTNARSQGALRQMRSIGITRYKCVNPDDERTCDICELMDGKTFAVEEAIGRLDKEISSDPEGVRDIHPWANNVSELKQADSLMASGYGYPPYHGDCRCGVDVDEESIPELEDTPDEELGGGSAADGDEYADIDWDGAERFDDLNLDGANMWGESEWSHWGIKVDDAQVEAIRAYQGSAYNHINRVLRGQLSLGEIDDAKKVLKYTSDIESALKLASSPKDMVVYRGVAKYDQSVFSKGAIIEDRGFESTSMSKKVASEFVAGQGAVLEILVPKGSQAAFLDAATNPFAGGEGEVLLQKGTRLHIISVTRQRDAGGNMVAMVKAVAETPNAK